ncbi:MAG: ATP-binding protein [Candidatus Riflebacteria bacterium HGW-Riflebacteria-2]|jgi:signal transduction histidine kinase|nr:MAG: ATP-binding protein [Candidatus Riflebacteria bacterium HGW-Riflebacteria-2]
MIEDTLSRKLPPDLDKLQMLGRLVSGITHEINTPMHYLEHNLTFLKVAFKDLMRLQEHCCTLLQNIQAGEQPDNSAWQELAKLKSEVELDYLQTEIGKTLEQSIEGIDMVSGIVLALKDFSHQSQRDFSMTDINKCIETACTISRHEWKKVADLQLELAGDLPFLFCSRDEIHQVLLNLIVNSAHAITEKKDTGRYDRGTITVKTKSLGDQVEIRVEDDGAGITEENRNKIFMADFTTKKAGAGTGFGLSLVRHIVEIRHHGNICFESVPGSGTVFTVVLPHRQPDQKSCEAES